MLWALICLFFPSYLDSACSPKDDTGLLSPNCSPVHYAETTTSAVFCKPKAPQIVLPDLSYKIGKTMHKDLVFVAMLPFVSNVIFVSLAVFENAWSYQKQGQMSQLLC